MQIDIFKIPIFINNIDCSKINLKYKKTEEKWKSETITSFEQENFLSPESCDYLLKVIVSTLEDFIKIRFKVVLTEIWENIYTENSFQENHIHPKSDFSFVIYKKIEISKTIFFAPNNNLINSFYCGEFLENYFPISFQPSLKENQIIIFPSFLEHMVKKISNSITIAGNLKITRG